MIDLLSGLVRFSLVILFCGLILSRILFWQLFVPPLQPFPHLYRSFFDLAAEADVLPQRFEVLCDLRQPCLNGIVRLCPMQLSAFSQQVSYSFFLRLTVGIQLGQRIDAVARQKFHLPDAKIQPPDV